MHEVKLSLPSPAHDPVPQLLPPVLRITNLTRLPAADGRSVRNEAVLFHARAGLRVVWVTAQADIRLRAGHLVSIRWLGKPVSVDGAIRINRLVLLERSIPTLDLFETIPPNWVKASDLLKRASAIESRRQHQTSTTWTSTSGAVWTNSANLVLRHSRRQIVSLLFSWPFPELST